MRPLHRGIAIVVLLLAAVALATAATSPVAATRLGARLRASGRADCAFVRVAADPFTNKLLRTRGRLSLELPDRARLEFPQTGERITLRGDGGEWLQPKLRQLIVFPESRAAGARRWWQLLMDGQAPGIVVASQQGRVLRLRSTDGAGPDSARLELDAKGLPARLVVPDNGLALEYRFSSWKFGAPHGASAYTQHAPAEFERVMMP